MQRLEVSGVVRPLQLSLGIKRLNHLLNTHCLLLICNQFPRMDSKQAQQGLFRNEIKDRHTD